MNEPITSFLMFAALGLLGALARVLVDLVGTTALRQKISTSGFLLYTFTTITVGALCGIIIGMGNISSFLGGYAGIDIIEGIYAKAKKAKVKISR